MDVILAIKPKYAMKILSGEKKVELRKKLWNDKKNVTKVYLYASRPVQKLVGYFEIENIYKGRLQFLWLFSKNLSCLSREEFDSYYSSHTHGSCIIINAAKKFKIPEDPLDLNPNFKIPQNFCYVSKELESKLNEIKVD